MQLGVERDKRSLFLCDREELVDGAVRALSRLGVEPGAIKSGRPEHRDRLVQVASVQTLNNRDLPPADIVICDEADLFVAKSYKRLIEAYPNAHLAGFTASPLRLDGQGLGSVFSQIIVIETTANLIDQGYLCEPRYYAPSEPDLKGVGKRAGEFDQVALGERVIVGDAVTHWRKLADGKPTLGFAVNCAHAESLCNQFIAAGIVARYVDSETDPRSRKLAVDGLHSGEVAVVWNVGLFGRGVDVPRLECVIDAAPTLSIAKFRQRLGRLTRPWPGKQAVYLDHAGNLLRHGTLRDEPEWSLEGRPKLPALAALHRCNVCFMVFTGAVCPCGAVPPVKPKPVVKHTKAELAEFEARRPVSRYEQQQATVYAAMLTESRSKGYKDGYAKFQYQRATGYFPSKRILKAAEESVRGSLGASQCVAADEQQAH